MQNPGILVVGGWGNEGRARPGPDLARAQMAPEVIRMIPNVDSESGFGGILESGFGGYNPPSLPNKTVCSNVQNFVALRHALPLQPVIITSRPPFLKRDTIVM